MKFEVLANSYSYFWEIAAPVSFVVTMYLM